MNIYIQKRKLKSVQPCVTYATTDTQKRLTYNIPFSIGGLKLFSSGQVKGDAVCVSTVDLPCIRYEYLGHKLSGCNSAVFIELKYNNSPF